MTQPQDIPAQDVDAQDVDAQDVGAEDLPAQDPESLGDPRVDAAVRRLADLSERPVAEHVEVFEDVHAQLRAALEDAAVEDAPLDETAVERAEPST